MALRHGETTILQQRLERRREHRDAFRRTIVIARDRGSELRADEEELLLLLADGDGPPERADGRERDVGQRDEEEQCEIRETGFAARDECALTP